MSLWGSVLSGITAVFLNKMRRDATQIFRHAFTQGKLLIVLLPSLDDLITNLDSHPLFPLCSTERNLSSRFCLKGRLEPRPCGNILLACRESFSVWRVLWWFTQRGWEFVHLENTDYVLDSASFLNLRIGYCSRDMIIDCVWETYG